MAGIGFELRKILRHDTFVSELKAYAYSALVSSGPWVMSVSCLAILGLYRIPGIADFDHEVGVLALQDTGMRLRPAPPDWVNGWKSSDRVGYPSVGAEMPCRFLS